MAVAAARVCDRYSRRNKRRVIFVDVNETQAKLINANGDTEHPRRRLTNPLFRQNSSNMQFPSKIHNKGGSLPALKAPSNWQTYLLGNISAPEFWPLQTSPDHL